MAFESAELPRKIATALQQLVQVLDRHQVCYALIGGVGTSVRSRPRFTRDLDFVLQVPQIVLLPLLEDLRQAGFTFDTDETIRQWTREHMTVLRYQGVRIDWLKPVLPLYQHVIDTASAELLLGFSVRIASAEGLILTKLLSFRDRDLIDLQSLLASNRGRLDLAYIRQEWQTVADADDPRMQRFETLVVGFYHDPAVN